MRQVTTIAGEEIFFEEYHPGKTVYALLGPYILYTTIPPMNGNTMIAQTDSPPISSQRSSSTLFSTTIPK